MPPPPIDKSKFGGYARNIVDHARGIVERGRRLLASPESLQEFIRGRVAVLRREQVAARLAEAPASDLRRYLSRGIRLGKIEQAGFRTVGLIHNAPHHRLLAIPGVGAQTVEEVKSAAVAVAGLVAAEARVRIDPDGHDATQTLLLAAVAAELSTSAAVAELREPLQSFEQRAAPLLPDAEKATSRAGMFWSGSKRKARAAAAVAELEALVLSLDTKTLVERLDAALRRSDPARRDADDVRRDFERDAAAYNTAIARITGTDAADAEAAEDFVGEELRQRIEAVPLDASLLKTDLRMYQVFGAKYAIHQEQAIIGDEMGLGKTIQALAVCAHLAAKGQRRFLVVCPASVQANWIAEIAKHTRLASYSLHGQARETQGRRWMRLGGVAVTTFDTLSRLQFLKGGIDPAILIVDEAHYIKNPDAKRSQAVAAMSRRSQRTLFLTGTPMENRVEEFKNLISYLNPRLAARVGDGDAIARARAFRRLVAPVYLRRNQEDVLTELPEKIEVEDWLGLNAADEAAYRHHVREGNFMGMRKAASAMPGSEKLDRLAELAQEAGDDGLKVIVFSYFLDVLGAVQRRLGAVAHGPVTGSVSASARQQLIDRFTRTEGPAVLVAQIEAGGVGLNIQAASVVVICEPQWKPSTEQQAIARAHRMGQARRVQVHRLLAKDCVDERIREIQENKILLFDDYARGSEAKSADSMATDTGYARPAPLDDESVPLKERVIVAERIRLGLD